MLNRNLNVLGATITIGMLMIAVVYFTERYRRCMEGYVSHLMDDLRDTIRVDTSGG